MILITGVTGYIGSHLAYHFDNNKIKYIGIDNLSYSYKTNLKNKKNFFKLDISNLNKINYLFKKYKITKVIHAAAFSYVMEAEKNKKKYYINNVLKTKKFINFCKKNNIDHFIFLSSSNVYEEKNNLYGFKETNNLKPKNFYGKNKLEIEKFLISKKFNYLSILRLFNVIGIFNFNFKIFYFNKKNYQRIIFKLLQNIKKKKTTSINCSNLKNRVLFPSRDFINIKDVIKIISSVLKNYKKIKRKIEILNAGSGKSVPINEIIKILKRKYKTKLKISLMNISNKELISTKANTLKLNKKINFNINLNLKNTIKSNYKL